MDHLFDGLVIVGFADVVQGRVGVIDTRLLEDLAVYLGEQLLVLPVEQSV